MQTTYEYSKIRRIKFRLDQDDIERACATFLVKTEEKATAPHRWIMEFFDYDDNSKVGLVVTLENEEAIDGVP